MDQKRGGVILLKEFFLIRIAFMGCVLRSVTGCVLCACRDSLFCTVAGSVLHNVGDSVLWSVRAYILCVAAVCVLLIVCDCVLRLVRGSVWHCNQVASSLSTPSIAQQGAATKLRPSLPYDIKKKRQFSLKPLLTLQSLINLCEVKESRWERWYQFSLKNYLFTPLKHVAVISASVNVEVSVDFPFFFYVVFSMFFNK